MKLSSGLAAALLSQKQANLFRTWLVAKSLAKGNGAYFDKVSRIAGEVATQTSQTRRTIFKHVSKLVELGWLGKDGDTYYVRKLTFVEKKLGVKERGGRHTVCVEYLASNLDMFKAYLFSLIVSVKIRKRLRSQVRYTCRTDRRRSRGYELVDENGNIVMREHFNARTMSCSFLSEAIGISEASVSRYKNAAIGFGFLKRKKHRYELSVFGWLRGKMREIRKAKSSEVNEVRRAMPEEAHRIQAPAKLDCVVLVLTDELSSTLENVSG